MDPKELTAYVAKDLHLLAEEMDNLIKRVEAAHPDLRDIDEDRTSSEIAAKMTEEKKEKTAVTEALAAAAAVVDEEISESTSWTYNKPGPELKSKQLKLLVKMHNQNFLSANPSRLVLKQIEVNENRVSFKKEEMRYLNQQLKEKTDEADGAGGPDEQQQQQCRLKDFQFKRFDIPPKGIDDRVLLPTSHSAYDDPLYDLFQLNDLFRKIVKMNPLEGFIIPVDDDGRSFCYIPNCQKYGRVESMPNETRLELYKRWVPEEAVVEAEATEEDRAKQEAEARFVSQIIMEKVVQGWFFQETLNNNNQRTLVSIPCEYRQVANTLSFPLQHQNAASAFDFLLKQQK